MHSNHCLRATTVLFTSVNQAKIIFISINWMAARHSWCMVLKPIRRVESLLLHWTQTTTIFIGWMKGTVEYSKAICKVLILRSYSRAMFCIPGTSNMMHQVDIVGQYRTYPVRGKITGCLHGKRFNRRRQHGYRGKHTRIFGQWDNCGRSGNRGQAQQCSPRRAICPHFQFHSTCIHLNF